MLVVDDEETPCSATAQMLEALGLEVIITEDRRGDLGKFRGLADQVAIILLLLI